MGIVVSKVRRANETVRLESGVVSLLTDEATLQKGSWSLLKDLKRITDSDVKGKCTKGVGVQNLSGKPALVLPGLLVRY